MQLQTDWPQTGQYHRLREALLPQQADYFCLHQGRFVSEKPDGRQGFLLIGWSDPEPVMACHSDEYQCLIDGRSLQPDVAHPLRLGMIIQAGLFRFSVTPAPGSTSMQLEDPANPDLDTLLRHGGHYTPWQASDQQLIAEEMQNDVLKQLGSEYKRYLLWGEQSRTFIMQDARQENRLPARDRYLDSVAESVKNKTLAECIFAESALFDRVFNELMTFSQQDIPEEEQPDILTALAPEHLSKVERRDVSELLYRELYKLGLDSHL